MQKAIRRFALVLAVALAALCAGIFASACGSNDASVFTITVLYSDGTTPVNGNTDPLTVQICDTSSFCYVETPTVNAEGKVTFDIAAVDAAAKKAGVTDVSYVIHVWGTADNGLPVSLALKDDLTVSASNPTVTVVLADRAAQ